MSDSNIEKLNPRIGDVFPLIAQTALTALAPPLGLAAMVYSTYIGSPASRRAEEFLLSLDKRLTALEQEEKINKNEILQDPKFNTIVMYTTQIAIRTHQEEKLTALRNAVINSTMSSLEENIQMVFLRILDNLTVYDIRILHTFYTNINFKNEHSDTMENEINDIITDMEEQSLRLLISNGLITESPPGMLADANNISGQSENNLGREFLKFIGFSISTEESVSEKV